MHLVRAYSDKGIKVLPNYKLIQYKLTVLFNVKLIFFHFTSRNLCV